MQNDVMVYQVVPFLAKHNVTLRQTFKSNSFLIKTAKAFQDIDILTQPTALNM